VEELGKPNSNKLLISSDGTRVSWGSGTVHPTHPQTETPASMWMDAMCKRLRGAVMQCMKSFYFVGRSPLSAVSVMVARGLLAGGVKVGEKKSPAQAWGAT